jgi:hypothetical protein
MRRRLRRLEEETGSGVPCEQCGHVPGEPIGGRVEYEIYWPDMLELSDIEDPGPELCPACGRRLVFTVEWLDLPIQGGGVLS